MIYAQYLIRRALFLFSLFIGVTIVALGFVFVSHCFGVEQLHLKKKYVGEENGKHVGDSWVCVQYLTTVQQIESTVNVIKGKLQWSYWGPVEDGKYIFVIGKYGMVISNRFEPGAFHHSSLSAGGPVYSAGVIDVRNGAVELIAPYSGHYTPGPEHMEYAVKWLKLQGVKVRNVIKAIEKPKWRQEEE